MDFVGLDELADAMKALDQKTQDSVLRTLNSKLAKEFIVERLKNDYPYKTSRSPDNFVKSQAFGKGGDKTAVLAGVTGSSPTAHLLELGTEERVQETTGRRTGRITAQHKIGALIEGQVGPLARKWAETVGNEINTTIERRIKAGQRKLTKLG